MQNAAAKTIIQWLMQSIDCEGARIVDGARPLIGPAATYVPGTLPKTLTKPQILRFHKNFS